MAYETVIGLEVHAQLNTKSKIFCGSSSAFGGGPNEHTCTVDLGLPGVLPVLNREVIEFTLRLGLAVGADIAPVCRFARNIISIPTSPRDTRSASMKNPSARAGTSISQPKTGGT